MRIVGLIAAGIAAIVAWRVGMPAGLAWVTIAVAAAATATVATVAVVTAATVATGDNLFYALAGGSPASAMTAR